MCVCLLCFSDINALYLKISNFYGIFKAFMDSFILFFFMINKNQTIHSRPLNFTIGGPLFIGPGRLIVTESVQPHVDCVIVTK